MADNISIDASHIAGLVTLARRAGDAIMAVYDSADILVHHKADDSPLTRADLAAHEMIAAGLPDLFDLPMISEEAPLPPLAERKNWTRYWLIDPLDGTREFIQRSGEFTVNIALIEAGVPVLGIVHVPAQQTTYVGVDKQISSTEYGAWKYLGDALPARIHVRTLAHKPMPLVVLASLRHGTEQVEHLMAQLHQRWPAPVELTKAGSSLKFCRIAEGLADFYPRLSPTAEWDTAAAQAVLSAAGGAVVSAADKPGEWLKPLVYNQRDTIINPGFYALGDLSLDWSGLLGHR